MNVMHISAVNTIECSNEHGRPRQIFPGSNSSRRGVALVLFLCQLFMHTTDLKQSLILKLHYPNGCMMDPYFKIKVRIFNKMFISSAFMFGDLGYLQRFIFVCYNLK